MKQGADWWYPSPLNCALFQLKEWNKVRPSKYSLLAVRHVIIYAQFQNSNSKFFVYSGSALSSQASSQALHFWNKLNRLRTPTGRRQTSWLCTNATKEMSHGPPGTNPSSGQSGTWTRDLQISSPAPDHSATLPPQTSLRLSEVLIKHKWIIKCNIYYSTWWYCQAYEVFTSCFLLFM